MEVIEHLVHGPDPRALERVVFGAAAPAPSSSPPPTPNTTRTFATLEPGAARHPDHRFEWTRAQFRAWAAGVADRYGYRARFLPVGPEDPRDGPPTQLAVFSKAAEKGAGAMDLSIPELSLCRADRRDRLGQVDVRPDALQADRRVISSDFCRGRSPTTRTTSPPRRPRSRCSSSSPASASKPARLTVVDATNVQPEARRELVALAREHDVLPAAIVLDCRRSSARERNAGRPDRDFGPHVLRRQRGQLRRGLRGLAAKGSARCTCCTPPRKVAAAAITRTRLYSDLRHEAGPFDSSATCTAAGPNSRNLLAELGYEIGRDAAPARRRPPPRRPPRRVRGDLVDRGPDTPGVLRLVMGMVAAGTGFCVAGKPTRPSCYRRCAARTSSAATAWTPSMEQLDAETEDFRGAAERSSTA